MSMRSLLVIPLLALPALFLSSCQDSGSASSATTPEVYSAKEAIDIANGLVRINSTIQTYNAALPWQKNNPFNHRGLGTLIGENQVITTAELVADSTYLEFESADETETIPAKIVTIDYKANLAILAPKDEKTEDTFFEKLTPLEIADPAELGSTVTIWQLQENGMPLQSSGTILAADTLSTFVAGQYFLTYSVKTSLQSASSSYTLPITKDGKLNAILHTYDSEDQVCEALSIETIRQFLFDASDNDYKGFPALGIGVTSTDDPQFSAWLEIPEGVQGLYITNVGKNSAAEKAELLEGDVLTQIDDTPIDKQGYYQHPLYGQLYWSNLIKQGEIGQEVKLHILRKGEEKTITATLEKPRPKLIPQHIHDTPPPYLIKGGLVFQELSLAYLQAFGDKWRQKAPINLLDALDNPLDYEKDRNRLVFLSRVIPTPATIGYDPLSSIILRQVNGQEIADLNDIAKALETPITIDGNQLHHFRLNTQPYDIYLDPNLSDTVDEQLVQRGLSSLSRLPEDKAPVN